MLKKIWNGIVRYYHTTDKFVWMLCLISSAMSVVLLAGIAHSGYVRLDRVVVQAGASLIGFCAMIVISKIDYQFMADTWKLHTALGYFLVLLTFVIGIARDDDRAWLPLIPGVLTIQPSELLKLSFIVTFSLHLQRVKDSINQPSVLALVAAHAALPAGLIMIQGDHGTAVVFVLIACAMVFAAGISMKYILGAAGAVVALLPVIWFGIMDESKRLRIISLFNPDLDPAGIGYQQRYGRIALGSGKLWGKGVFSGNHQYVPEMYNDFIFSFIGEALGLLGCLAVIFILSSMCMRILYTGTRTKDALGHFICVGIFAMIVAQMVMNSGMCLSLLPVIGVTLPLFSGGGTSVVVTYMGMGLYMSVYMHNNRKLFID